MKTYTTSSLRNVGIVGHGDTGKTQLVSSLLYTAGMTPRLGKVAEGSTVTDWDDEEIARKISIQTGIAFAEWARTGSPSAADKTKINFLDTPGYSTFVNETRTSLIAADAALVVVDAVAGVQVVTEKVWDYCTEYGQPRAIVINWMDRELANFERALASVQEVFGRGVVPVQLPIGAEKQFRGVVDLVSMKALIYTPDGDGRGKVEEIPADMAAAAKEAHEKLVEMVAEGDDTLMEEFFEKGTLPLEDLTKGLRLAFREQRLFPVMISSALHNIGSDALLNLIVDVFPDPAGAGERQRLQRGGREGQSGGAKDRRFRASVDLRVQDAFGSFRRAHQLLQGDVRRAEERRQRDELQSRDGGALSAPAGDAGEDRDGSPRTACRRPGSHRQTEGDGHRRHSGRQGARRFFTRRRGFPSRPSPLPSSRKRGPTRTASAWGFTRFWRKTWRCAFRATRRPRSFCWRDRASSTSRWWWPSCGSASRWT